MANYSTNEFRSGLKVIMDGDPCSIVENEFVKPGKGQAFSRVRLRKLKTGRVWDKTFKSGESLEGADVAESDMQYLYNDGEYWHFMEPDTFEQHQADKKTIGDSGLWLREQDIVMVTLHNGVPLLVTPANHVELEIIDTDPGLKGDTTSKATKSAVLETGATIQVPLFVTENDIVKIDTRSKEYVSRVKA